CMIICVLINSFFFSSRRRHTRSKRDWSSDVCSSDLISKAEAFRKQAGKWGVNADTLYSALVLTAIDTPTDTLDKARLDELKELKIGRASCREREWSSKGEAE